MTSFQNTTPFLTCLGGDEELISLLPFYAYPKALLVGDKLPCHGAKIESRSIAYILKQIKRNIWIEGLYAKKIDLHKIKRYQNLDKSYKNDFDDADFLKWVKAIEENTAICDMENKNIGKGVFVPPGKMLPKGTFLPSSGVIKLDPTKNELETKVHCSALQDLDSRKIIGLIDPEKLGGMLDIINHAPDQDEMENFKFKDPTIKKYVSVANLASKIKFYNGYSIMGVEVFNDIHGGENGKQLLWSYAQPCEYIQNSQESGKVFSLFNNRSEHDGEIINVNNYTWKIINIFIDIGEPMVRKVASLSRWEIMKSDPESSLIISTEDPYSSSRSGTIQSPISNGFLQMYLKNNPIVDRIIVQVPL
jgi:hypothetical protein